MTLFPNNCKAQCIFSSIINEVIRVILESLFFYKKISQAQKSTKSTKSTKRHKDTQGKAQNAYKRISDYFPLRWFLRTFFNFDCL